jgi:formylglycine-generating enzyme
VPPDQEFCIDNSTKATCAGDGMSSSTEPCPAQHFCDASDGVLCLPWVCEPGAAYCEDNKATVCNGKGSAVANEIDCGDNYCVGGACKPVICGANTSSCDGNKVMQCDATGTVLQEVETCGDDQYCGEDGGNAQCKDQVCQPGLEFCDGSKVMLCNNIGSDDSLVKDCADGQQGCKAGECVDQICTPNATYCDGNVVKKCSGDGTSASVVETCGVGQYCGEDGNAAACANQVCTPNAKTCQGNKVMECDDVGAALEQVKDCADDGDGCVEGGCVEQLCGALSFDGQNNQVEIAHSTSLNLSASVTIAVWFQSSGVANNENIIRKGTVHSSYFMWLKPPMKLEYGVYTGSAPHVANGTSTLEADKWYHFVMTYDGETVRGYLNGAPHGTVESPSGDFNTNQLPVRIGYGYPELWNNAFFSGKIDEVAIWSTALGEQAIEDALLLGIQPGQEPNLVGLWTFDNSSGQGKDLSDEGNDGVVDGATWISEGALCSGGAVCGDGQQAVWEECDDGNELMCDGCEDCQSQGSIDLSDPLAAACTSAKSPSPSAWTVETWVRFDDLSNKTISYVVTARVTAYPVVENTKVTEAMYLYWTGGSFVLKARYEDGSDNDYFLTSQTTFEQGIWYHVAYVRAASGEQKLYINGKQEASSPSDPAPSSLAGMTCVGSTGAGTSAASSVHGLLDELRVSNIERYSGDFIPARRFTSDGNTLGLWHFDEGTGGTALDAGPSGHDLIFKDNADWAPDDCYGTSPDAAICGDGQQAAWEECDDGNEEDGDGCNWKCKVEEMVTIPEGAFWMGCNQAVDVDCEADESPYHQVTLDEYSIDLTEVTFGEYDECVQEGTCSSPQTDNGTCLVWTGSKWQPGNLAESFKGPNRPVVCVDWLQASTYCQWNGKRLCSEAEWEKAARGDDGRKFPWGNQAASCAYAVMDDGAKGCGTNATWDVCSKPQGNSPYGLCDMSGNVWDWVADKYAADYYSTSPDTNPQGPVSGTKHIIRGGSFGNAAINVRVSVRSSGAWTPGGDGHVGVRCCQ